MAPTYSDNLFNDSRIREVSLLLGYDPLTVPDSFEQIHQVWGPARGRQPGQRSFFFVDESDSLRKLRCSSGSTDLVADVLNRGSVDDDWVSQHALGMRCLSQAKNRIYEFDYENAYKEIRKWQLPDTPHDRDIHLKCNMLFMTGRVLKGQGHFGPALQCFEACLRTSNLPVVERRLITAHLSDVSCELDYIERLKEPSGPYAHESQLNETRQNLQQQLQYACVNYRFSSCARRLLLSFIEISIRHGHIDEARRAIDRLLTFYSQFTSKRIDDKVGHVRTLIAMARVSVAAEAEHFWNAALAQNRTYNPKEEEVFTCAVIYLHISLLQFQRGYVEGANMAYERAINVLHRRRPRYIIPGLATYVFDEVRTELCSRASSVALGTA